MSTPVSDRYSRRTRRFRPLPLVHKVFGEPRFHTDGDVAGASPSPPTARSGPSTRPVLLRHWTADGKPPRPALPLGPGNALGVQPRCPAARQRQRRPDPVGRRHRATGQPDRAAVVGDGGRVQRGRANAGQRPRRRRGPVLGCRDAEVPRRDQGRARAGAGVGHRLRSARRIRRHRRRRPRRPRLGRASPTSPSANWSATPTASRRWPGARTAACSSPPGGTRSARVVAAAAGRAADAAEQPRRSGSHAGVQPGRQVPGLRRLGLRHLPVDRPEPRPAAGAVLRGHNDEIRCLAFSPDGTKLASAGLDRVIHVWDVRDGKLLAGPNLKGRHAVAVIAGQPLRLASSGAARRCACGTRRAARRSPPTGLCPAYLRRRQPGRQVAGHRRHRPLHATLERGRGHPGGVAGSDQAADRLRHLLGRLEVRCPHQPGRRPRVDLELRDRRTRN